MSSGGGGTQQVQSTTNTSNLPAYAQPYVMQAFAQAQGLSNQAYTPYQGQQVANFTPDQLAAQQAAMGLQAPSQYGTASNLASTAGAQALNIGNTYTPMQFNAQQAQAPILTNLSLIHI